ncbi:unnamed protein product, partial [Allacma fusca]
MPCSVELKLEELSTKAISKVPPGPWLDELRRENISISDVGIGSSGVEILIGADAVGKLMTGRILHLKSGLVAIETKLGWTLMGEIPGRDGLDSATLMVNSLLNTDSCLQNLWQLEAIGIRDPVEVSNRKDLERAATEHFR